MWRKVVQEVKEAKRVLQELDGCQLEHIQTAYYECMAAWNIDGTDDKQVANAISQFADTYDFWLYEALDWGIFKNEGAFEKAFRAVEKLDRIADAVC